MATSAQYWRIFVNAATNGGAGQSVNIAELVFYGAGDFVPISTAGATATASSTFSNVASNVIDQNVGTMWTSSGAPTSGSPEWVQVQFTGAVSVAAVAVIISNSTAANFTSWTSGSPTGFLVQSSPNGTTWTTQNTVTNFVWDGPGQVAYFDVSTTVGSLRLSGVELEVITNPQPRALLSQVTMETVLNASPKLKLSQVVLEVLYPFVASTPNPIQQFLLP